MNSARFRKLSGSCIGICLMIVTGASLTGCASSIDPQINQNVQPLKMLKQRMRVATGPLKQEADERVPAINAPEVANQSGYQEPSPTNRELTEPFARESLYFSGTNGSQNTAEIRRPSPQTGGVQIEPDYPTGQSVRSFSGNPSGTTGQRLEPAAVSWYPDQNPNSAELPAPHGIPYQQVRQVPAQDPPPAGSFQMNFNDDPIAAGETGEDVPHERAAESTGGPTVRLNGAQLNPPQKMASERALELLAENRTLHEQIKRLQQNLNDGSLQIRGLREQLQASHEKMSQLQETIFSLESDKDELRAKLQVAKIEQDELKREMDASLSKIEADLNSVLLQSMSERSVSDPDR